MSYGIRGLSNLTVKEISEVEPV